MTSKMETTSDRWVSGRGVERGETRRFTSSMLFTALSVRFSRSSRIDSCSFNSVWIERPAEFAMSRQHSNVRAFRRARQTRWTRAGCGYTHGAEFRDRLAQIVQDFILFSLNESTLQLLASNIVIILFVQSCSRRRLPSMALVGTTEQLRALLRLTAAAAIASAGPVRCKLLPHILHKASSPFHLIVGQPVFAWVRRDSGTAAKTRKFHVSAWAPHAPSR